jgi:hypothetical protein
MKTKKRIWLILLILAVLFVASVALTWTALAGGETATGGSYHLTRLNWQVTGISSAGGYHLQGLHAPALTGNGCCCTYLPCVKR